MEDACKLRGKAFERIVFMQRNVSKLYVVWRCLPNSAISACEKCEQWQPALDLLAEMRNVHLEQNGVPFGRQRYFSFLEVWHWQTFLVYGLNSNRFGNGFCACKRGCKVISTLDIAKAIMFFPDKLREMRRKIYVQAQKDTFQQCVQT